MHRIGETDKDSKQTESVQLDNQRIQKRSASRDSSLNDDPRSLVDSLSAVSGRQTNWSGKETAEDVPSMGSIKGDSVSATMADYDRKHRAQPDSQSRTSGRLMIRGDSWYKTDDATSNINFYPAGNGSTSGFQQNPGSSTRPGDFVSICSNTNVDAFEIIEESSNISSSDDLERTTAHKHKGRRSKTKHTRHRASPSEQALDMDNLTQEASTYQVEPIIIRGDGNLTLFGLSNSFSAEFPSALIGRVSREEFDKTMRRVNSLLRDQQSLSAKLLLFGGLCCCCSFGLSLVWPSIALRKRSKANLEKFLANENSRLYSKLGLNWKLAEQRCYSNHAFVEYVLMIEFTPKINLYLPD